MICPKLPVQCSAIGRMCHQQTLVPFSFPSLSGFGFMYHPACKTSVTLIWVLTWGWDPVSQAGGCLMRLPFLEMGTPPQPHSYLSHLLDAVTSPHFVVAVEVTDKLVFYFHSHFWFVCKTHQIYFLCKDFVTKPDFKSFSWSSSHITLLYSETFPEHILFQFVPSAGPTFPLVATAILCQVDFR